jgi:hypothetical protein
MKYYILTISVFILKFEIFAQNQMWVSTGYGRYLINSENSMKVLEDEKVKSFVNFGFGYQREDIVGFTISLNYNYFQNTIKDAMNFIWTDQTGNNLGEFTGDYALINHTFDLNYCAVIDEKFSYGFGPSFVITNRVLDINLPSSFYTELYDKLASSGLGLSGFIKVSVPFNEKNEYFFFTSKVKLRYTYSIWFDEGLRKLDDYYQEFFTVQLLIGLGYSFND